MASKTHKPKSTTPNADEKHALYASLYARHKHETCFQSDLGKHRCEKCGKRFMYVMSEYAMWFGSADHCMTCACGITWFHTTPREN